MKEKNPDLSYASWAIRFAAGLDGILAVLSGMSNVEQMKDNLSYMKDFRPLDEEEMKVIHEAQKILGTSKTIGCTACSYCTKGCPQDIPIPDIFKAMNLEILQKLIAIGNAVALVAPFKNFNAVKNIIPGGVAAVEDRCYRNAKAVGFKFEILIYGIKLCICKDRNTCIVFTSMISAEKILCINLTDSTLPFDFIEGVEPL
jgi:ferredoxin